MFTSTFYFEFCSISLEEQLAKEPILTNFYVLLNFSLFTDVLILVLGLLLSFFSLDDTLIPRPLEFDLFALDYIISIL